MPCSRAEIPATAGAFAFVTANPGLTAEARAMNSRTASNWLSASRSNSRRRAREVEPVDLGQPARVGRGREARHRVLLFARHPQRDAGRDQAREIRAAPEEVRDDRARGHDLLEVVQDQQHPLLPDVVGKRVHGRAVAAVRHAEHPRDRGGHQGRVADRFERHEPDPVRELVGRGRRDLQREPGLAGAARPGQAQQPGPGQQRHGLAELLVAADEGRELGRQVVRPGVQRPQRREVGRHAIDDELGEALRGAQVLQPMLPEVAEGDAVGQRPGDEGPGLITEQDLAAVGDRGDPRRPVDGVPDDVGAGRFDVARVEAHPDADHDAIGPRLGGHGSLRVGGGHDRVGRAREDDEERVAFGALLEAAMRGEGRPKQLPVTFADVAIRSGAELDLEARRALDVGEQAGDGPGRRTGRRLRTIDGGASWRLADRSVPAGFGQRPKTPGQAAQQREGHGWLLVDDRLELPGGEREARRSHPRRGPARSAADRQAPRAPRRSRPGRAS